MAKQLYIIRDEAVFNLMCRYVRDKMRSGEVLKVRITNLEDDRTLDQNAALWPILQAFSTQKKLAVNGFMADATPEDWKDVLTAAFENEGSRVAQGLDGRPVFLGQRTSRFTKAKFSEFLEFLHATAAQMGVEL